MIRFNKFLTRPVSSAFLRLGKNNLKQPKALHRNFVRNFSSLNIDASDMNQQDYEQHKDSMVGLQSKPYQFFGESGPLGPVTSY